MSWDWLYELWDALEYGVDDLIYSLIIAIREEMENITDVLYERLTSSFYWLIDAVDNLAGDIGLELYNVVGTVSDALSDLGSDIWQGLGLMVEGLGESLSDAFSWVYDGINSTLTGLWDMTSDLASSVADSIGESISDAVNWLSEAVSEASGWIGDKFTQAWEGFKDIADSVYDYISELVNELWEVFVDNIIPALGDMLVAVIESEPVGAVLEAVQKVISAAFEVVFSIDKKEFEEWIGYAKDLMTRIAQEATA